MPLLLFPSASTTVRVSAVLDGGLITAIVVPHILLVVMVVMVAMVILKRKLNKKKRAR